MVAQEECRTPDNHKGNCVTIQHCQSMKELLHNTKPITPAVARILAQYQCGFDGQEIKVCCPPKTINLLESRFGGGVLAKVHLRVSLASKVGVGGGWIEV